MVELTKPLTSAEILGRLRDRLGGTNEWAVFPQVRSATGFGKVRTADAIAINTWPSRGLEVHGFEFKSRRSDWLRELKAPAKAEEIARYCDRWWIVVGERGLIHDGELPPTWGAMVPRGTGLEIAVDAPKLTPLPFSRPFLAGLLRNAAAVLSDAGIIQARLSVAMADERKRVQADTASEERRHAKEIETIRAEHAAALDAFRESTGIDISDLSKWNAGRIGEAVAFARKHGVAKQIADLQNIKDRLDSALKSVTLALNEAPHEPRL